MHASYLHDGTGAMICIESSDNYLLVVGELDGGGCMEVYRFLTQWHYRIKSGCD